MKILIVEDETLIASRISRMVTEIAGPALQSLKVLGSVEQAESYLQENTIDLLLLDLNLTGKDGFEILKQFAAEAFHTIVISAQRERAIEAFEYGVIDFVPKPFDHDRLILALDRARGLTLHRETPMERLAVKVRGEIKILNIAEISYFRGADIYSEIHLKNGEKLLYDKTLEKLSLLLGTRFERIHRSFLVAGTEIDALILKGGSAPVAKLKNGELLPVGRTRYNMLKKKFL